MHISKTRQLLGLLNFCLLSGAESEMERIDLLSTRGALPWAGPLTRPLGCHAVRSLSHPASSQPPVHSVSLSFSGSAWRLSLLQLTLVLPLLGKMCAELLTLGLICFPSSHKLHLKLQETHKEAKIEQKGLKEAARVLNMFNQNPSSNYLLQ